MKNLEKGTRDKSIGITLKQIRKSHRLTLKEMADKIGTDFGFISCLESNKKKATLKLVKRLRIFNYDESALVKKILEESLIQAGLEYHILIKKVGGVVAAI